MVLDSSDRMGISRGCGFVQGNNVQFVALSTGEYYLMITKRCTAYVKDCWYSPSRVLPLSPSG